MSRDGEWLMTKDRIVKYPARLFLTVTIALALVGSLPATVEADGNPVDLELGGEGATSWNIGNIKPGDSGTKTVTLHNAGDRDGFVAIWISDLVSNEGDNPESETGNTAEPGELHNYLLFNISCSRLDTNISLPTTIGKLPHSASDPGYIKISPLNVGDTITLDWQWQLPVETGNEVQGDRLSFTINYMIEEFPPPSLSGWWPPPPPPPGTTDVRGIVTTTGRFMSSVTALSEDGLCKLTIPAGTVGLTKDREPLTEITMLIMDEPPVPPADANVIGLAYDFGPDGATFDPPITLTFTYDPEGIAEEDLVLAYYDQKAGEWVNLGGTVDTETNTITAAINHFTAFAVLGYEVVVPPPGPEPEPESTPTPAPEPPLGTTNQGNTTNQLACRRRWNYSGSSRIACFLLN